MYPLKPSGDNILSESNIFASTGNKIPMTSGELLGGYSRKNEVQTDLTSQPDAHKFNSFLYQAHNTVKWLISYAETLYANKLEKSGGTMSGIIDMGDVKITNLADATNAQDAMNLQSVQALLASVQAGMLGEAKYLSYPVIPDFSAYGFEVVEADGRAISRTTYSDYFAIVGTTFGSGNGSTTFNIPDLRGVVIRGWDNGRGLDSGHAFGAYQADAFQGHYHNTLASVNDGGGGYYDRGASLYGFNTNTPMAVNAVTDGSNGTPRIASETRMKNISLYPVIRIK